MGEYVKIPELYDYNQPRVESYSSQPIKHKDLAAMLLYEGLNAADWAQTRRISRNPDNYYETPFPQGSSQIIGKHPRQSSVDLFHIAKAIGQPMVASKLSEPWRSLFQLITIGMAANTVSNNAEIGLKAFRF